MEGNRKQLMLHGIDSTDVPWNQAWRNRWSRRWELNPQPAHYECAALPLSYAGKKTVSLLHKLRFRVHLRLIQSLHLSIPDPESISIHAWSRSMSAYAWSRSMPNYAWFTICVYPRLIRNLCLTTPDSKPIFVYTWSGVFVYLRLIQYVSLVYHEENAM